MVSILISVEVDQWQGILADDAQGECELCTLSDPVDGELGTLTVQVLGEIANPRKTLTIAGPLAVGGVTILYVLANASPSLIPFFPRF